MSEEKKAGLSHQIPVRLWVAVERMFVVTAVVGPILGGVPGLFMMLGTDISDPSFLGALLITANSTIVTVRWWLLAKVAFPQGDTCFLTWLFKALWEVTVPTRGTLTVEQWKAAMQTQMLVGNAVALFCAASLSVGTLSWTNSFADPVVAAATVGAAALVVGPGSSEVRTALALHREQVEAR